MERLRPGDVVAIDVHVHAELSVDGHDDLPPDFRQAVNAYFKGDPPLMDPAGVAGYYRERRMRAVVFSVDAELTFGHPRIPNEEIAAAAAEHDDVLIPFASIDPHRGTAGVAEALPAGNLKAGTWAYDASEEEGILNGHYYVNVHTNTFPGGEVRGQIVPPVVPLDGRQEVTPVASPGAGVLEVSGLL